MISPSPMNDIIFIMTLMLRRQSDLAGAADVVEFEFVKVLEQAYDIKP